MGKEITDISKTVSDLTNQIYNDTQDKKELDYWNGISQIIIESQKLRYEKSLSQGDLADIMDIKQSVISRFENMGRLPSYDFFARLALAFDHSPGMTLFGDYMAVVPLKYHNIIDAQAAKVGKNPSDFVQELLDKSIKKLID